MTPPVLVTAPATSVVTLADLKAHLRVSHDDEDALITALETSAVAYLDGWKGALGRAIRSQVWRQEFETGEKVRLLLPDVSAVTVTAYDAEDAEVSVTSELKADFQGAYVEITGAYERVSVDFTCVMHATQLPAAQAAVKLLVGHWYEHREAVTTGPSPSELPMAVNALVTAMRWVQF